jgi:protein involved in polysaccharide export with SLBB domain
MNYRWSLIVGSQRFKQAMVRCSGLILSVLLVCGGAGFFYGYETGRYSAEITLVRPEEPAINPGKQERVNPDPWRFTDGALLELLRSPELRSAVHIKLGSRSKDERPSPLSNAYLEEKGKTLHLELQGLDPNSVVSEINLYADSFIEYLQTLHSQSAREMYHFYERKISELDQSLQEASAELYGFLGSLGLQDFDRQTSDWIRRRMELQSTLDGINLQLETLELQIQSLLRELIKHHPTMLSVKQELDRALLRYTEEHPKVKELRATLALLEARIRQEGAQPDLDMNFQSSPVAQGFYTKIVDLRSQKISLQKQLEGMEDLKRKLDQNLAGLPEKQLEYARRKSKFDSLEQSRKALVEQLRAFQLVKDHPPASYRVLQRAQTDALDHGDKYVRATAFAIGSAAAGFWAVALTVFLLVKGDRRIRTPEELTLATQLPLLATLGDVAEMTEQELDRWGFDTLTSLKGKLNHSQSEALVCGFTSSNRGEGRSTWVRTLAQAARKRGYRVLTVFANPARASEGGTGLDQVPCEMLMPTQALFVPSEIARSLATQTPAPSVDFERLDWVWNLECRQQWQQSLQQCQTMENLIALVELPPISEQEGVLLAENMANVIWLCGRDMAELDETRSHIETLRYSRAELAGAVFNRAQQRAPMKRAPKAAALLGLALALWAFSGSASAQDKALPPTERNQTEANSSPGSFSISSPDQMAAWQKRLTLGPGDVLTVSMYEQPDSLRAGLAIGPDGRLNYLQARDVLAAGLTVDELRGKLEAELGKFYRPPLRVVVIPQTFNSKKYYILGNVVQKGVYTLDRPMTVIEAIARAQGFASIAQRRNTLMLADLSRSFLVRREPSGAFKRENVDFEALFLHGDLRQNIPVAPDDYLFFPPLDLKEVYVLGEVVRPGPAVHVEGLTVLRAIISQGGFRDKAFRSRVLVVRGSLNQPQTFVVNVNDILAARTVDFKLEPRDIVYVSRRPWAFAEELVELAVTEFFRAAIISWTGHNVGPFITEPIVK